MEQHFISCYEKSKRNFCNKLFALEQFYKSPEYIAKGEIFNKTNEFVKNYFTAKRTEEELLEVNEVSATNKVEIFLHNTINEVFKSVPFDSNEERYSAIDSFIEKTTRLYRWYVRELVNADEIIAFDKKVTTLNPVDETEYLYTNATAVVKVGDTTEYIRLHRGRNKGGLRGSSFATNPYGNLDALVCDLGTQGNILYVTAYLEHDKEEDSFYPELVEGTTKGANVIRIEMGEYKKLVKINKVPYNSSKELLTAALKDSCNGKCEECFYKSTCRLETLDEAISELPTAEKGAMKDKVSLNAEQTSVVEDMTSNMVVCAGPGTGKTATLVGKVLHELKNDTPASAMLCITYTNKAVKEIKDRLEKAGIKDMPTVCTIDALAYSICRENSKVLGFVPGIITMTNSMEIIKGIIFEIGPDLFSGQGKNLYGKAGKIRKSYNICIDAKERGLEKVIADIESHDNHALRRYGDVDTETVKELYELFCEKVTDEHLYEFSEIKSLCINILTSRKYVREGYQNNFDVIFVDEYQDVNKLDHGLVKCLWNSDRNRLIVFGDDDQNIYAFRGGESSYMLEFANMSLFRTVVLKQNYRNDESIMQSAKKLIKKGNFRRIAKDIVTQMSRQDCLFRCVDQDAYDLDYMISTLIKEGYSYGDICVTGYSNEKLKKLKDSVSFPACLSTRNLIDSALFNILEACSHICTDDALAKLCIIFKQDELLLKDGELFYNIKCCDCDTLKEVVALAENYDKFTARQYISNMADLLGLENSFEYERIKSDVNQFENPDSFKDLNEYLYTSLKLESDTQFDIDQKDRVMFITQHKSKGLEWPVVIYITISDNVTPTGDNMEPEFIHRMYVTMTRAKNKLIVCGNDGRIFDALDMKATDIIIEGKEESMGA